MNPPKKHPGDSQFQPNLLCINVNCFFFLPSEKGIRDFSRVQSDKVLLAAGAITAAIFVNQPNAFADILRELHNRIGAYPLEVAVVSSLLVGHLDPIV
jgi:hypothetical protein